MHSGDRIGHGTALGIAPALWKERIRGSSTEYLCCDGEWLDNLVWLCQVLQEEGQPNLFSNLHQDIKRLYHKVYGRHDLMPDPHETLHQAWEMRKYDPQQLSNEFVMEALKGKLEGQDLKNWTSEQIKKAPFDFRANANNNAEIIPLVLAAKENIEALNLFRDYHQNMEVRSRYGQTSIVKVDCLSDETLKIAQDYVINKLNDKNILVEVMPTSNKCISFYKNYGEHRLVNWLKRSDDGSRPVPHMTIASDDPGIFATTLRNEYSHVVNALINHTDFTRDEAYSVITKLNGNAKEFAFRKDWSSNQPESIW